MEWVYNPADYILQLQKLSSKNLIQLLKQNGIIQVFNLT